MKENVGRIDRSIRALLGPALMALGYTALGARSGRAGGLVAMIGGALILDSAITRVCPVNTLIGLDTRTEKERERDRMADRELDAPDAIERPGATWEPTSSVPFA